MTKKLAAATSAVMAAEPDVQPATKLHVQPAAGFRARPVERLYECPGQGLMLACAPADSGKTVLLADWPQRGQPHPSRRPGGRLGLIP